MRQLEKEFKGKGQVKGYDFTQLQTNGKAYIYQVKSIDTNGLHYEVFKHKENTQYDCVSYPKTKSFGIWAWTYTNIDLAMNRYNDITNKHDISVQKAIKN